MPGFLIVASKLLLTSCLLSLEKPTDETGAELSHMMGIREIKKLQVEVLAGPQIAIVEFFI